MRIKEEKGRVRFRRVRFRASADQVSRLLDLRGTGRGAKPLTHAAKFAVNTVAIEWRVRGTARWTSIDGSHRPIHRATAMSRQLVGSCLCVTQRQLTAVMRALMPMRRCAAYTRATFSTNGNKTMRPTLTHLARRAPSCALVCTLARHTLPSTAERTRPLRHAQPS